LPEPPRPAGTLAIIDLARTLAIFLVVQMHFIISTLVLSPSNPWALRFWLALSRNGVYGVFFFFVVSGFLITRLLDQMPGGLYQASPRRFYVRRFGRIIPLFLLAVGLGLLIRAFPPLTIEGWAVGFSMAQHPGFFFWFSLATFTFNWFVAAAEGVFFATGLHWDLLWTLSIEEQFYLTYPWILRVLGKGRRFRYFLLAVIPAGPAVRAAAASLRPESRLLGYMVTPGIMDCIAWGAALYLAWKEWGPRLRDKKGFSWSLAGGGVGIVGAVYFGSSSGNPWDLVWVPTALSLGLSLFLMGGLGLPFFQGRLVRALAAPGKLSYGIYLLHMVVLYVLSPWLKGMGFGLGLTLFLGAAVLVAWTSNHYFEKPLNLWIRGWEP
jgi:peptidoglycan/LPS O-acetylase OafA/YrhL